MVPLVALKRHKFGRRWLDKGDAYQAKPKEAKLMIIMKRAAIDPASLPTPVPKLSQAPAEPKQPTVPAPGSEPGERQAPVDVPDNPAEPAQPTVPAEELEPVPGATRARRGRYSRSDMTAQDDS